LSTSAGVIHDLRLRLPAADPARVRDLAELYHTLSKASGESADGGRKAVLTFLGVAKERSDGPAARFFAVYWENLDAGLRDMQRDARSVAKAVGLFATAVHTADDKVRELIRHAEEPITVAYGEQLVRKADMAFSDMWAAGRALGDQIAGLPGVRFADTDSRGVNRSGPAGRALARDVHCGHIRFHFADAINASRTFARAERHLSAAADRLAAGVHRLTPAIGRDVAGAAFRHGYLPVERELVAAAQKGTGMLEYVAGGIQIWHDNNKIVQWKASSRFTAIEDALDG
jgi:hypothetical protein